MTHRQEWGTSQFPLYQPIPSQLGRSHRNVPTRNLYGTAGNAEMTGFVTTQNWQGTANNVVVQEPVLMEKRGAIAKCVASFANTRRRHTTAGSAPQACQPKGFV
jgi:hypothetical protein